MYFAEIDADGVCFAELETDRVPQGANLIQVPGFGYRTRTYNRAAGTWSDAPPPPPLPRRVTRLAFLTRFTDPEAIQIDLASIGATVEAATVRRYLNKVNAATYIDLDDEDTRSGVQALEGAGLLAAGRAAQILDAEIQPGERP